MYPACDVCLLDARVFRTFPEVAKEMKRVRSSSGEVPVVFFLHFAYGSNDERTLWKRALAKVFGGDAANADSARQYHLSCEDGNIGLAVITLGTFPDTMKISSVRISEASNIKKGPVHFGEHLIYVELQFQRSTESLARKLGIVWAADLTSAELSAGLHVTNTGDAVAKWILANVAINFMDEDMIERGDSPLDIMCSRLSGVLVLSDMRGAKHDKTCMHNWHIAGRAFAIPGRYVEGKWKSYHDDALENQRVMSFPACYRVHFRSKEYYLPNHTFDVSFKAPYTSRNNGSSLSAADAEADCTSIADANVGTSVGDGVRVTALQDEWIVISDADADAESSRGNCINLDSHADTGHSTSVQDADHGESIANAGYTTCTAAVVGHAAGSKPLEIECLVCLDKNASMVFRKCGHFGVCGACAQRLVKTQFNAGKSEKNKVEFSALKMSKLKKVAVLCPCCRLPTSLVWYNNFVGRLYAA